MKLPRLAITMGDPSGIGPEIVLKALADPATTAVCRPVVLGDLAFLRQTAERCGLRLDVPVLDVASVPLDLPMGTATAEGGQAAWACIRAGVDECGEGRADALVTAPLSKYALELAGHGHDGHTELLQAMTGSPWSLTLFVTGALRTVFLTRHLPLRAAIDALTADRVVGAVERFAAVAGQIGLDSPRIAVAALNPHAGENGLCGTEEIDHLEPAVATLRERGFEVEGPVPADAVFHLAREGRYDVVLSLYHDQAAAVLKSIDFHGTVSVTLGLPFLRFSVDHGTAFDIAGKGVADARNMVQTLLTAARTA